MTLDTGHKPVCREEEGHNITSAAVDTQCGLSVQTADIMRLVQFIRKAPGWKVQVFGAELGEGGDIVDLSHIAPSTIGEWFLVSMCTSSRHR